MDFQNKACFPLWNSSFCSLWHCYHMYHGRCSMNSKLTMTLQLHENVRSLHQSWQKICSTVALLPVQLPSSVALPEQGIFPPTKLLLLLCFASLSHVPWQALHGSHVDHEPSTKDRQVFLWHSSLQYCYILWQYTIPEQLSASVALPEHGIVPLWKLLVLFLVASLSHVPEHVAHGCQTDHEPSTRRIC